MYGCTHTCANAAKAVYHTSSYCGDGSDPVILIILIAHAMAIVIPGFYILHHPVGEVVVIGGGPVVEL